MDHVHGTDEELLSGPKDHDRRWDEPSRCQPVTCATCEQPEPDTGFSEIPVRFFKTLFEKAPAACFLLTSEGVVRHINDTGADFLGGNRDSLIGGSLADHLESSVVEHWKDFLQERAASSGARLFECRLNTLDGESRYVEIRINPVIVGEDGYSLLLAALVDVTARKQADDASRRNEELLKLVTEGTHDGIWEWDVGSNRVWLSDDVYEMLGTSKKNFGGTFEDLTKRCHPDDLEVFLVATQQHLRRQTSFKIDIRFKRGDDSYGIFSIFGKTSRNELGEAVKMAGSVSEVTEIRQLEGQLLEASDREQSRIAQDLHDGLCQRLTGIGMMSERLARGLKRFPEEGARAARISEQVYAAIKDARMLVHGINPCGLRNAGLTDALWELCENTAKTCEIDCDLEVGISDAVVDPALSNHLYRIAQEAINNAIRHGHATHFHVRLSSEDGWIRLTVRDDGCGISETDPKKSGMGMRIMRYRADVMGGTLDIRPAEGGGTVVSCCCPYRQMDKTPVEEVG